MAEELKAEKGMSSLHIDVQGETDDCSIPKTASSGFVSVSCSAEENPFKFDVVTVGQSENFLLQTTMKTEVDTPITIQKNICLNATSNVDPHYSDDDEYPIEQQKKICICATSKNTSSQESVGAANAVQRKRVANGTTSFPYHTHNITDDYTISHEVLGIGESGKVMACYKKETNEKYALKVLRDGPKARREVDLHYLSSVHENVLTIIDIYENTFGGVKCLLVVVEFVEGGDLLTRFENQGSKPYSEEIVGEIIRQVGSAVKYLHDMNIAHRDIKLENILCSSKDDNCIYKLADFGFAKRPERNTLMESPCCTPFYVAPEILAREQYDKSCDMWALGVVTYILLCGYPPFYSVKGLPLSPGMKTRIASGCYAFPRAEWDCVSQNTKNEIRHLLRTDPAARMTIDELMQSPLVTGKERIVEEPKTPDEGFDSPTSEEIGKVCAGGKHSQQKSIKLLNEEVRDLRLHSIQEEVGRALDMMRLGNDSCFIKNPKFSSNSLLARRRSMLSKSLATGVRAAAPLPKLQI